jgi:hypothetical protein
MGKYKKYTKQELLVGLYNHLAKENMQDVDTYRDFTKAIGVMVDIVLSEDFPETFNATSLSPIGGFIELIKE